MTNGCVCCVGAVREDLVRIVRMLVARPDRLDHIIVETSGLADPYPVAQTFFLDDPIAKEVALDAVVTMVDAKHIRAHLDDLVLDGRDKAVDQIVCADHRDQQGRPRRRTGRRCADRAAARAEHDGGDRHVELRAGRSRSHPRHRRERIRADPRRKRRAAADAPHADEHAREHDDHAHEATHTATITIITNTTPACRRSASKSMRTSISTRSRRGSANCAAPIPRTCSG